MLVTLTLVTLLPEKMNLFCDSGILLFNTGLSFATLGRLLKPRSFPKTAG